MSLSTPVRHNRTQHRGKTAAMARWPGLMAIRALRRRRWRACLGSMRARRHRRLADLISPSRRLARARHEGHLVRGWMICGADRWAPTSLAEAPRSLRSARRLAGVGAGGTDFNRAGLTLATTHHGELKALDEHRAATPPSNRRAALAPTYRTLGVLAIRALPPTVRFGTGGGRRREGGSRRGQGDAGGDHRRFGEREKRRGRGHQASALPPVERGPNRAADRGGAGQGGRRRGSRGRETRVRDRPGGTRAENEARG